MGKSLRYILVAMLLLLAPMPTTVGSILDLIGKSPKVTAEKVRKWGLSMKVAMWQKHIAGGGVQCRLCPFHCILDEGERGICGVRASPMPASTSPATPSWTPCSGPLPCL